MPARAGETDDFDDLNRRRGKRDGSREHRVVGVGRILLLSAVDV